MHKKPALVVMAAGIGSRFGGIKQLASLNDQGNCIIDYSLYDALQAGFRKVVFVISRKIQDDFKCRIGKHAEKCFETYYITQEMDLHSFGYKAPVGREKPWGTGHAVLSCADVLDAPFAVINGDDFYGRDALKKIYSFLSNFVSDDRYAMAGFRLENTLSEYGSVSRGICSVDPQRVLLDISERTHIISTVDGPMYTDDSRHYTLLSPDTPVSMNMWGFPAAFLNELRCGFEAFCRDTVPSDPLKAEFYLPSAVNRAINSGTATVQVLPTDSKWYGITYQKDLPCVRGAVASMTENGLYPSMLWE